MNHHDADNTQLLFPATTRLTFLALCFATVASWSLIEGVTINDIRTPGISGVVGVLVSGVLVSLMIHYLVSRPTFSRYMSWLDAQGMRQERSWAASIRSELPDDLADQVVARRMSLVSARTHLDRRVQEAREREAALQKLERLREEWGNAIADRLSQGKLSLVLAGWVRDKQITMERAQELHLSGWSESLIRHVVINGMDEALARRVHEKKLRLFVAAYLNEGRFDEGVLETPVGEFIALVESEQWPEHVVYSLVMGELSVEFARGIHSGQPVLGMTFEMVEAMWDEPDHVSEKVLKTKTKHIWTYYDPGQKKRKVLKRATFDDGVVVGWDLK